MAALSAPIHQKIDTYLVGQIQTLATYVKSLKLKGVSSSVVRSLCVAKVVNLTAAKVNAFGVRVGSAEYDYAIGRATILGEGITNWVFNPEAGIPYEVTAIMDGSNISQGQSKSISNLVGKTIGGTVYKGGQVVGGAIERGSRVAGEWIGKISERL